jgi:hypothetical protein
MTVRMHTPARPTRSRTPRPRAFALPLVLVLILGASLLVTLLLTRRSTSRLATKQQADAYIAHHMQLGLRDFVNVFLTTTKRSKDSLLADGVVGFDLQLDQGLMMEVRLKDLGGAILASAEPGSVRGQVLARAVLFLQERIEPDLRHVRVFGPPRVSVHGSPPEALEALALAVDPDADGRIFARELIEQRQRRDLSDVDVRNAGAKAGIAGKQLELLAALTTVDPNFWWIEARVLDRNQREIFRQGGFASGAVTKRSAGLGEGAWNIELWQALPRNQPFASALDPRLVTPATR